MHSTREWGSPNDDVLSNKDVELAYTVCLEVHVLMWYNGLKGPTGTQTISVFLLCCPLLFCPYYIFGFLALMFVKAGSHWENKRSSRSAPSAGFCWHLGDLPPCLLATSGCHGGWKVFPFLKEGFASEAACLSVRHFDFGGTLYLPVKIRVQWDLVCSPVHHFLQFHVPIFTWASCYHAVWGWRSWGWVWDSAFLSAPGWCWCCPSRETVGPGDK